MSWFKSKPEEPLTAEQVRAERPDLSEETAQAVVAFVEQVKINAAAREAERRAQPLRQRVATEFGLFVSASLPWFKLALGVIGWFAVWVWWLGGFEWYDYALRVAWIIVGLVVLAEAFNEATDSE